MRSFNVTLTEVAAALRRRTSSCRRAAFARFAGTDVAHDGKITTRRLQGGPIADRAGYVVRLKDIAEVVDGQELRSASFLNGKSAVTLIVQKQSGQNSVTVAEHVKARLAN